LWSKKNSLIRLRTLYYLVNAYFKKEIFDMPNLKLSAFLLLSAILLTGFMLPAFAAEYNPGVTTGQYVKYGNFVGKGLGVEAFNDYDWLKLQVTDVSGKMVTLLSTSQYKNGTAIPGNGSTTVWNVESGIEDGLPSTQGPIIAANLNQGDSIPPLNTYTVNRTENRAYLGVSRSVNILDVTFSAPDYNTSLTYVYDRASGMLLESTTQTTTQAQPQPVTTTISYNIIETNIFGPSPSPSSTITPSSSPTITIAPTPSPTIPEFPLAGIGAVLLAVLIIASSVLILRKKIDRPKMLT
jgi:hypothetical protein